MKLHLPAKVPSEGARRVAQWVVGLPNGLPHAARLLGTDVVAVQRIIAGEIEPGLAIGVKLSIHAGIRADQFAQAARGGWFDRPAPLARAA
jgi:hypothetical protein